MTEHTPTPWECDWGTIPPDGLGTYCDVYIDGGDTIIARVNDCIEHGHANAAFIIKAVNSHDALLEFFKWAMREGPWDGGDLDGGSVQDKAEVLGLIVKTQYDAEKHGVQSDFEHGDDWFEYAPQLKASVGKVKQP